MILREMDPLLARAEFIPMLQEIFTKLEHDEISVQEAIDQTKQIQQDVKTISDLTITTRDDRHQWAYLTMIISNMLAALADEDYFKQD